MQLNGKAKAMPPHTQAMAKAESETAKMLSTSPATAMP